ncbi:NADPH-dependent oxidoreductase [Chelatococcus asaccharovorans]|uniref:Nitroreductase n=1 Tax=Chelatococcus asaccharovorans TaxID=28210 RepID=A0A2V3UEA8_9HYPH|nr:NADPH-dependent oxidoreductase [Chelatococcus asaccharovorans]MBS7707198.1 NADPH-dependent oxidoreductase [Chelatococcus asaccharovorans]PXW63380.1 nitroreductase [Chelatococcus asaccharovorans]
MSAEAASTTGDPLVLRSDVDASDTPEQLLAARYGRAWSDQALPWNEVIATLLSHRSVRAYLPKALPDGTLETLVAAAQSASSSSNLQTWSVIAVTDPARKDRLATLAADQDAVREAPLLLVWLADLSRLQRLGDARDRAVEGLAYLELLFVAIIDAALAAQNALVAAESLGLGGVYIGAMRNRPAEVAAELGLPPQVFAVFGLCIGYPDPARQSGVKPRLGQNVVLHRERYVVPARDEVADYDETMEAFQREQAMGPIPWSERVLQRVAGAGSLSGRDQMRAILEALGFGLR